MRTSQDKASRLAAKAKTKKMAMSSDSDSDDESDAAQFISREAEEGTDSDEPSSEDGSSGSDDSEDDSDNSDDSEDDDDDDLPPMQLFSSQPIKSTSKPLSQTPIPFPSSAMPRLGGASTKNKNIKKAKDESSDSGDSDDSDSSSNSDSVSDSDSGSSDSGSEKAGEDAYPSLSQEQVKSEPGAESDNDTEAAAAKVDRGTFSDSESDGEEESEEEFAANIKAEAKAAPENEEEEAEIEEEEEADVDSSDDGLDEIPSILPPGTQADVDDTPEVEVQAEVEAEVEVPSTAEEALQVPEVTAPEVVEPEVPEVAEVPVTIANPRASPYDIEGLPTTPIAPPKSAARARASVAPSSQDQATPSQPTPKTKSARKQRAKVPFVEKETAAEPVSAAGADVDADADADADAGAAAEPMEIDSAESVEKPQDAELEESTSQKKRKRGPVEESLEEDAGPETPAQAQPAKKAAKKSAQMTAGGASTDAAVTDVATKATPKTPKPRARASTGGASTAGSLKKGPQGNFTPQEVDEMKRVAQQYMEDNDIRLGDFNVMVQDNATKHLAFWKVMSAEFPDHKRLQVILRLRRIYHNFAHSYNWTPEHDGELADLVGKYGNKWQLIGGLMDRSSEDVRKRWDEHVVCGNKMRKSYWRFDEEKRLGRIVGEVLKETQASRGEDTTTTHEPQEDAINDLPWQLISERMEFTRTARQCRIKWRVIHQSYHFDADGALVGPPEPENLTQSQLKAEKLKSMVWSTIESPGPAIAAKAARTVQSLMAKRESATPKKVKKESKTPKSAKSEKKSAKSASKEFGKSAVIPLLGITPDENGRTVPETDRPINDKTRQQVRAMTPADKHALVLSIRDSNVGREDMIPWPRIADAEFRKKYSRAARELVWSRLKRSLPNYHRKSVRQICDQLIAAYSADQSVWDALDDGEASHSVKSNSKSKAAKSSRYVAESDSDAVDDDMEDDDDDEDGEGVDASPSKTQKPAKHPRAARKVNGYAENEQQVPESDDEEEEEAQPKPEDIEVASEAEADSSQAPAAEPSSVKSRSTREPSVDLSTAVADTAVASVETEATASASDELPEQKTDTYMSQSLSPGLAKHQPTALARMRTNGQPLSASASKSAAKRFGTTDTSSPLAKQRSANGEIRRTKKRPLGSAQWHADDASASSVYDDIEDVSDDARRRSQGIRGLGVSSILNEFNADGSRPVKRIRQDNPKRTY